MNDRNRNRGNQRRGSFGAGSRDVAHDWRRGRNEFDERGGDRYTSDRDWSDEDRYQRDSESGGGWGGSSRSERWQGGESYGAGQFQGSGSQRMYGPPGREFGSGEQWGPGRYDERRVNQRRFGQGIYEQGGYGQSSEQRGYQGGYGQGGYGQSDYDRGQYAQGQYGEGQYGQGQYGGQYAQGQSARGQQGQGQYAGYGQGQYGQGQYGPSSAFGRGQYDYSRAHEWGGGMGQQGESWQGQQNYAGRGPKGYQRSDDRLKEQVSDRLMDDPRIDASEITVEIHGGEVTLTGMVNSREEKRAAEACAESVSGVREVINQLRVNRGDGGGAQSGRSTTGSQTQTSGGQTSRSSRTSSERSET